MNKFQKLLNYFPKEYLFSNYAFAAVLTFSLTLGVPLSGEYDIFTAIIGTAFCILSMLLYPFAKGLYFAPGKSPIVKNVSKKPDSIFATFAGLYIRWGISMTFTYMGAIILGPINVLKILNSKEDKVSWYDEYEMLSNVKAILKIKKEAIFK